MTCYEVLACQEAEPELPQSPMAHHIVKWWRAKFRNGYKKFSVGGESERTDTEELVGRQSQCSAPPDLLPSEARALLHPSHRAPSPRTPSHRAPSPRTPSHRTPSPRCPSPPSPVPQHRHPQPETHHHHRHEEKHQKLRFEELTCDVQLQHEQPSRQQPLQFSFTLYDLDGHGRITKDDIAGIVSTIYESIGKSVTVPHYGSKTIQVRLTVVPESSNTERKERNQSDRCTRREGRRRPRRRREAPQVPPDCGDATDDERRSRISLDDDGSSCSGDRRRQNKSSRQPPSCQPARAANTHHAHAHQHKERERRSEKKRSGSLQRRELLEIIQANMEKNHLSFQTSRKPSEQRVINEEEVSNKHQRPRNRAFTVSEKPAPNNTFHTKHKSENPGNGYLDLAQTESHVGPVPSNMDSNLCRYDRYLHAVICSSAKHANSGYHQKSFPPAATPKAQKIPKTHHRSRSHDFPPHLGNNTEPRVLQIIFL